MLNARKFISLILIATVGLGLFWQTFTVVHFYANQKEITEKYCENKDKPQMKCEGKCHLQKKLTVKKINTNNLIQTIEEITFWIYGVEQIHLEEDIVTSAYNLKSNQLIANIQDEFLNEIFIPPNSIS